MGGGVEGGDGAVKRNKMNAQMLKYRHENSAPVFLYRPSFDFDSSDFWFLSGTTVCCNAHAEYEHAKLKKKLFCGQFRSSH